MSETELRNADIDAALNEVKEAYVAHNPKSLARYVEATAVMPGGNTRTVLHFDRTNWQTEGRVLGEADTVDLSPPGLMLPVRRCFSFR